MKKLVLFTFFVFHAFLFSQEDDSYNLDYNNSKNATELCTKIKSNGFLSNSEADNALAKILSVVGASKRFIVAPCENINNALAIIEDDMRYILYDPEFINSISQTSNYWANMSILAHEVGHHINGHTLSSSLSAYENKIQELEADEFSGFVMQKIGSTLDQAVDAIASISPSGDDTYSSHPNKERRIKAITKGYNNAENNSFVTEKKLTDWEEYFFRAGEKYDAKDYEGAIKDYTESLKLKPDANTYFKRALAKGSIKDYSGEKFDLIRSIELEPTDWKPYYYLGLNLYYADDYYGALSAFDTYLNLTEWSGDFYDIWTGYYMAKCLYNEDIYSKSLKYIDYIITEQDFTSVIDANYYGDFYQIRGRNYLELEKFDLAKKDFEKASELNPEIALNKELIGDVYAKEKNYQKAIEFYNQALKLDPNKYSIYQYRAYAYESLEDYFSALLDMNEAIKHAPEYGYLYFKRGEYSYKMGDKEKACSDWLTGREKGHSGSLDKLLEICGYSKFDFFSADDFMDEALKERTNENYDEALKLLNKSKELGYEDTYYLEGIMYSLFIYKDQFDLALEILNNIENDTDQGNIVWWNNQYLNTNYKLMNWSKLVSKTNELIERFKLDPDALDYSLNLDYINENVDFVYNVYHKKIQSVSNTASVSSAIDFSTKFLKIGKAIENNNYIADAYFKRAELKKQAEDYFGAIQDINEYIKFNDDYSDGYRLRGEVKLKMGEAYSKYACEDFIFALEVSIENENENEDDSKKIQDLIDYYCKQ